MAKIVLMPQAKDDLERIFDYFTQRDATNAAIKVAELVSRLGILEHVPLIGRPLPHDRRELLVGKRHQIYAVHYQYDQQRDTVYIIAIRSRRQAPAP
jgi:plasmid stabilization system protein ParE